MAELVVIEPIDKQERGKMSQTGVISGDLTVRGVMKNKAGKLIFPEDFVVVNGEKKPKGRTMTFPGQGFMLDLSDPEQKGIYTAIMEDKGCSPKFLPKPDGSRGSSQRFQVKSLVDDAKKYLESRDRKVELDGFIAKISKDEKELRRFALIFGLSGDKDVIKANLYKMADDDKKRGELAKMAGHIDRVMIELIHASLAAGSKNEKKGLWQDGKKMFYWYETPLAINMEGVMAYFKDKDNEDLYKALKDSLKNV